MKKFVSALAAVSALVVALPVAAQDYGHRGGYERGDSDRGSDYGRGDSDRGDYGRGDYGRSGYGQDIGREIERLEWRIERSRASQRISYREAQRLSWQVRELKQLQRGYWRNDGRLSGWERNDLQRRVDRIKLALRWQRNDDNGYRDGYVGRRY